MKKQREGNEKVIARRKDGHVLERGILVIVQSSPGQVQRGIAALEFLLDSPNLEYSM